MPSTYRWSGPQKRRQRRGGSTEEEQGRETSKQGRQSKACRVDDQGWLGVGRQVPERTALSGASAVWPSSEQSVRPIPTIALATCQKPTWPKAQGDRDGDAARERNERDVERGKCLKRRTCSAKRKEKKRKQKKRTPNRMAVATAAVSDRVGVPFRTGYQLLLLSSPSSPLLLFLLLLHCYYYYFCLLAINACGRVNTARLSIECPKPLFL